MSVKVDPVPTRAELSSSQRALLEERLKRAKQASARTSDSRPSIARRAADADIPLSFAQERLWFLDQLEPGSAVYNVCQAVRMEGVLNVAALKTALNEIVRRHEVLRTNFVAAEGRPVQTIHADRTLALSFVDLLEWQENERHAEMERRLADESRRPFDLARDPLIRGLLIRTAAREHTLLLTLHHIISDGWSVGIMFRELADLYAAACEGRTADLPELPIQYADYVFWERDVMQGTLLERLLSFWRKQLQSPLPVLELPVDRPRSAATMWRGAAQTTQLSRSLTQGLKALAQHEGATLFMTLLAAFQTLLHRWTGQEDIVVGSVVAGRRKVELEKLIGFFVNTLVFRGDLAGDPTFRDLLVRTRETAVAALAHQDLPFERLVKELRPDRSATRNPLFQVMFVLQTAPMSPTDLPELRLQPLEIDTGTSKFDLTLLMIETPDGLRAALEYNADLFEPATVARMLVAFESLLESVVANPDQRISGLTLLSAAERHELLTVWNATAAEYPRDRTIPQLFEEQVARSPHAVAVAFESHRLTYLQLDAQANQLARWLRKQGVGRETLVCVCLERSIEAIVALLGILKAGGAYVSLDPTYPPERQAFMLRDTAAPVLLTERKLRARVDGFEHGTGTNGSAPHPVVLCLDSEWSQIANESESALPAEAKSEDLAYVSYTSGSTGQPKGVCVPHRGVVRLVKNTNFADFGPNEILLQFAPVAFDASTLEIWGALLNGGRLVVYPPGPTSLSDLGEFIERNGVTTLWLTAGLFHQMVEEQIDRLRNVRQLLAGGDVLSPKHVARVLERLPRTRLINGYGPTENTTFTCCHHVTAAPLTGRSIPIGKPIANTQVYILDRSLQPVPIGVPGDLYAAGDGLACGYLNRPELTREKFLPNPFAAERHLMGDKQGRAAGVNGGQTDVHYLDTAEVSREFVVQPNGSPNGTNGNAGANGALNGQSKTLPPADGGGAVELQRSMRSGEAPTARIYRTGDRARWLPDGTIEFLGRSDRQVKIRGFRVEPAEIETVLGRHPQVKDCAVIVREDANGDKRLVAYIVPHRLPAPGPEAWREYMVEKLPDYLVPSAFFTLEALPLTPNGKLDVAALPAADGTRPDLQHYVAPRDDVERRLTEIWEAVLGVHPIGVHDQFFALGGHSLLAVRMAAQLEKAFDKKLPVAAIFQHRTIEQLAALLRMPERGYAPVSSIVEIQGTGTRPRLYLVHGVGGGMFWGYANLARRLGPDQPLFAFKSRGLDGLPEWPTIEEMAANYIADLRAQQPHGPYLLGGYCFGGIVAYEMARQLSELGEEVSLLALINGSPPNIGYTRNFNRWSPFWQAKFLTNFAFWCSCFLFRWGWRERAEFVRWKLRVLFRRSNDSPVQKHAEVALGDIDQLFDLAAYSEERRALWRSHVRALIQYHAKPYSGRITLIRTRGHPLICSFDRQYGWGELTRGGVDVKIVPGGHGTVLAEPFVESVAATLRPCLDEAAARAKNAEVTS